MYLIQRCLRYPLCVCVCHQMGPGSVDQTYYQGRHCGENWGDERKPIFIQQGKKVHDSHYTNSKDIFNSVHLWDCDCVSKCLGSFDISSLPESKGQAAKTAEMPTYVNTQQIDAQVLAALQAEAENVTKGMATAAKESPQKDLFDMSESFVGM